MSLVAELAPGWLRAAEIKVSLPERNAAVVVGPVVATANVVDFNNGLWTGVSPSVSVELYRTHTPRRLDRTKDHLSTSPGVQAITPPG
jgi:hypothetical protein